MINVDDVYRRSPLLLTGNSVKLSWSEKHEDKEQREKN